MKRFFPMVVCMLPFALFAQKPPRPTSGKPAKTAVPVTAQEPGIHFQHGLSWEQVKAKAKKENKYIFMDCFTTWCGPCRYMSKNIFPQEAVGNAMNTKFISVKMQLDTTDADKAEIKACYADAHNIATQYNVNVYPTFLFFSPDGKLVHRAVGSSEVAAFIAKTEDALNPATQYYTLLSKYEAGQKDSAFLHSLVQAAMDAYDMQNSGRIANDYLATQSDLYTAANLSLIRDLTRSSKDKGFQMMISQPDRVDSVLGKGTADAITKNIIMREEVFPKMFATRVDSPKDMPEPDWSDIRKTLEEKYPARAASLLGYSQVVFYMNKNDWEKFGPAVVSYMKSYGDHVSENQLNEFAWTVFQNCNDETCLQNALEWSKRSFQNEPNPMFMDTYANILYRLGKTEDAIAWEQKAKDAAPEGEKSDFQKTIDKMKAGEKTWN